MALTDAFSKDILDSLGEGVFTVDKNFRINFFNRAAEKITGFGRHESIGRFCKQIFDSSLCLESCPISRVLEEGENLYDISAAIRHKSGREVPIRINAAVLRDRENHEPVGGVISFRDLSDLELLRQRTAQKTNFYNIIGRSKIMREIFQLIEDISDSDASVLVQGESGTGKEMIANAIQATSIRHDKPYIKVNCSVFPPQLLASELFGHVRGAFTGAVKDRIGRFEMADQGTLFLDEVAEMSTQMQLQLLRVLQEGTFERVGESLTRKVDVRIIAATNNNLPQTISEGSFREDLYYRLNVIPVELPPLRERLEDLPFLIEHFLRKFSESTKKSVYEIEDSAMELILNYSWPGNVRELENAIECAVVRTKGPKVTARMLPATIRLHSVVPRSDRMAVADLPAKSASQTLLEVLEKHHWNRSKAARELRIGRTTLWRKMKTLGLNRN